MTTAVGNNSRRCFNPFFPTLTPAAKQTQNIFIFGEWRWIRAFIVSFCVHLCVFVCVVSLVHPQQTTFSLQTKESQIPSALIQKQRTKHPCFKNTLWHMHRCSAFSTMSYALSIGRTHIKGDRCFLCFSFLYLQTGAVTNVFHTQVDAWVWTDLNWCYSRRNQCIFLTAAITPLTSIHQEICMR